MEICHLKKKIYIGGGKKKVNYFIERIPGFSHASFWQKQYENEYIVMVKEKGSRILVVIRARDLVFFGIPSRMAAWIAYSSDLELRKHFSICLTVD
jgi:hypothetical protein